MFTANVTQKHMMQMMYDDDEVNNILALSCVFEFLTTMISTVFFTRYSYSENSGNTTFM